MKFINTRTVTVLIFFLLFSGKVFSQVPVADFTIADADGCAPHTAVFTSTSSGSSLTYDWDFHDPNSPGNSNIPNPSHIYTISGQYSVTLTVTNTFGTNSITKDTFITVFKGPTALYTVSEDTICSGQSVTYIDASIPGDAAITKWEWIYNDGFADSLSGNVTHTYTNPDAVIHGYLTVFKPTDSNGCNSIISTDSIFVYPATVTTSSFDINVTSCSPFLVDFTNSSTGPALYNWDFGDPSSGVNNTSTLNTPSHLYNSSGSYLVTLTNGYSPCTVQDTMTIIVAVPVAEFSISDSIVCPGDSVSYTNMSTPPPLSSMTYQWRFGDLSPINFGTNPKHAYNSSGTYTVQLTARIGSCSNTTTHSISVRNAPSISFTSPDRSACNVPFDVTFKADTISTNIGWLWDFGDPTSGSNSSTLPNPVHTYSNIGNYTVKLIVTDIYGCRDSVSAFNYVLIQKPQIDFSELDSGCVGKIFNYNSFVVSPADTSIQDYTWDFGDGTPTVSGPNPDTSHQFITAGKFDITLTITTQSGCTATKTKTKYAIVGTIPDAQIDSIPNSICFKDAVSFHDISPPPITSWLWEFGDGNSTEQNPTHRYEIDTSGAVDPYDIILIARYNGCADTDTVVNMVSVLGPIPVFDTTFNCFYPDSVHFTDLSGGADSLFWNFGDSSPIDSVSLNPSHIYSGSGDYMVTLTAKNNSSGCVIDTTLLIAVRNVTAVANSDIIEGCHPVQINFDKTGSQDVAGWQWTYPDGIDTIITSDSTHIYNRAGFYTATLTTFDVHGCFKTDTQLVHIKGPTANFTANPLGGCSPLNVTFQDNSLTDGAAINSWIWDYGTQEQPETTLVDNVTHTFISSGLYSVKLTVTDANGCSDTHTNINFINPTKPTAGIFIPDTVGCKNTPELFIGNAGPPLSYALPVTYTWNFGDGQTFSDTSNQVNHSYASNGNYDISLKVVDANGCVDSTNANIFVFSTSANFTTTTTSECVVDIHGIKKAHVKALFHSDSTQFVTNSISIFNWNFTVEQFPLTHISNYLYDYNNVPPGNYDVTLILTNDRGCTDTVTQPGAIVIPGPTGSFSFIPDSGCSPLTVNFTGTSTNSNLYAWDFGDGNVITGTADSTVSHIYTAVGLHQPQFLLGFPFANETCYIPVLDAGNVVVTSSLIVNILEDSIIVNDGETGLLHVIITDPNGVGPPYTYVWDPVSNITNGPGNATFTVTPTEPVTYYNLSVPYGVMGCSGVDVVKVIYIPCDELTSDTIPNVFTPNGDSQNDTYYIKNLCKYDNFRIRIFNRWGKLIYESTDPGFHWDGNTTGGTEASEGVYYYVLNAKTKQLHGYIDLIRNNK